MATSFPLASLAPTLSATGVATLTYADILASLKASAGIIFGTDVYLEADSQDGQLLAIFALAIYDCGQVTAAVYNAFSPATAVGGGLSSVVKINHIARLISTRSQVNVAIGGTVGTTITSGVVGDLDGNRWALPGSVTIPGAGTITVTATAEEFGALRAAIGSVTKILTPTAGWQTVLNAAAASPGQPVESDGALRARQEVSPAIYSVTPIAGLAAALNALSGVTYGVIYENDTGATDSNGVPAHAIAVVVKGGVAATIAATIYAKKAPGVGTYGSTTIAVLDAASVSRNIKFSVPTEKAIKVEISLHALTNYNTAQTTAIKQAVANAINALAIGEAVIATRLYAPAQDGLGVNKNTFKLYYVYIALASGGAPGPADVVMAFTEKATCLLSDITVLTV